MAGVANVESTDALVAFRTALVKFLQTASSALGDAEADINRTIQWLENEQQSYWNMQIRKRQEALARAEEALRQKTLFKDSSGSKASASEELKQVQKCRMAMEEAQLKLNNTKKWSKQLHKEATIYKGAVQRFATCVSTDVPAAIGHLGALVNTIQEYEAISTAADVKLPDSVAAYFGEVTAGSSAMARGGTGPAPAPAKARPFADLRARPPGPAARLAAKSAPCPDKWTTPSLQPTESQALGELSINWQFADGTDKVVLARSVAESQGIFLERATIIGQQDSGWYIGSLSGGDAALEATTIAELVSARRDLERLLALPPGYLVVIDSGGVAAVISDQDQDMLRSANAGAAAE
jgi:hypothetical protein